MTGPSTGPGGPPVTGTRYLDRLGELVEPGERVLALARAGIAHGVTPKEPPDAPRPPGSEGGPGVLGVLLNLLMPNVVFEAGDRLVDLIGWGVAGRGAPGSTASWLVHTHWLAGFGPGFRDTLVAVTDRRLLVCLTGPHQVFSRTDAVAEAAGTEIVWSTPRAGVARARVGWHRLNPKRLRIDFADGSWLAFTVPIAESGRPLREVAAALSAD